MSKTIIFSLLFTAVGMLFMGISVPLILERVPPNNVYGFRTRKTLSDPKIWYAANRASGHHLLVAGAVVTASSAGTLLFGHRLQPEQVAFTLLAVMVLSLVGALSQDFRALRKL